jgi:hypothetical protein
MQTRKRSVNVQIILLSLFVVLFVFFFYAFLHEVGHALTGLLFGQSLTEFNVSFWDFSAHVSMVGGELTEPQFAIQAVAGAILPLLVWGLFISLVPQKASFTLEILKLIASMAVLNTLLAWIVIPVLYVFGSAPISDDVTNFLQYSRISPWLLSGIALILYIRGWSLFLSKIEGLRNEFLLFSTTDRGTLTAGVRTILPLMTGILITGVISAYLLNASTMNETVDESSPPPGFAVVAEMDLSKQAYSAETLAEFTLEERAPAGVFIAIRNINTSYFDLRLLGENGYSSVVMHGEGYRAERDGGLWRETLRPGTYQLVLTSHQSSGTISVFLKAP